MNILKGLLQFTTGLSLLLLTFLFPLFKIVFILLVASYLLYMAFKYRNWTFVVPSIGGGMNLTAILLNGGKMPVLIPPGYLAIDPGHTFLVAGTHVKFLCDIFPLMHLGLFSIGDVTIAIIWPLTILGYMCYSKYTKRKAANVSSHS